jgi:photosystem II stability/assembly factor-like uncharacterized protein
VIIGKVLRLKVKKKYSISFSDKQNSYAVSADDEFFITTDGGETWEINSNKNVQTASLEDINN